MPGMPFHLEKGHALMALEDLLNRRNDDDIHAVRQILWSGLNDSTKEMGTVFREVVAAAPQLDEYGGQNQPVNDAKGLGGFVTGAWFGETYPNGTPPDPYWLDYAGEIGDVVREALLYTMETAWEIRRPAPLPDVLPDRRIELFWHCAQRWFDCWVTWDSDGPVMLLFATPAHLLGEVRPNMAAHVNAGRAVEVNHADPREDFDMVIVTQEDQVDDAVAGLLGRTWQPSTNGDVKVPPVGATWRGTGDVGTYSVHANAGGMRPRTIFE